MTDKRSTLCSFTFCCVVKYARIVRASIEQTRTSSPHSLCCANTGGAFIETDMYVTVNVSMSATIRVHACSTHVSMSVATHVKLTCALSLHAYCALPFTCMSATTHVSNVCYHGAFCRCYKMHSGGVSVHPCCTMQGVRTSLVLAATRK